MPNVTGESAGKIWEYLKENGPSSATKIVRDTNLNNNEVQRAVGWLNKEDKLVFERSGRTEKLSLKE
ncbi:MAG: winged helix-turn-helix domain-containing protein [Methylococcales bacterium]|nr:winged helix-turn-helix domain-containing protein [Methylococcales bacterium]